MKAKRAKYPHRLYNISLRISGKEKNRIKKLPENSIIRIIRDIDLIIRSHELAKGSEVMVIYMIIPIMSCKHSPGSRSHVIYQAYEFA